MSDQPSDTSPAAAQRPHPIQHFTGRVLLIQESRFLVQAPGGANRLFTLSEQAPLEPQDLRALAASRALVTVAYRPGHPVAAASALRISVRAGQP